MYHLIVILDGHGTCQCVAIARAFNIWQLGFQIAQLAQQDVAAAHPLTIRAAALPRYFEVPTIGRLLDSERDEMLSRLPVRFARLLGKENQYGHRHSQGQSQPETSCASDRANYALV